MLVSDDSTPETRARVACATLVASDRERFPDCFAMEVALSMSLRRVMESLRRGPMSRRSRRGLEGKEVTVLFSATVASEIVVMAAIIDAPSATARAIRNERGRSERCILMFALGRNGLRRKVGMREGWREVGNERLREGTQEDILVFLRRVRSSSARRNHLLRRIPRLEIWSLACDAEDLYDFCTSPPWLGTGCKAVQTLFLENNGKEPCDWRNWEDLVIGEEMKREIMGWGDNKLQGFCRYWSGVIGLRQG
jgi:hypothetical protein